jgi:hypothetical protein
VKSEVTPSARANWFGVKLPHDRYLHNIDLREQRNPVIGPAVCRGTVTALETTMRKSILAAASVLALGIGGVEVGNATPGTIPSVGHTTQWSQSYGVSAPAQPPSGWPDAG